MDRYINALNFDFRTNHKILQLISFIDSFKSKWNLLEGKENFFLKELKKIASIESIGSSTRIEGARLSNDEINSLLQNVKITKLTSRDEQEVVGYYDVLQIILENYDTIKISKNYIQQFHQRLLMYSEKDERHRGVYKNLSNQVVAKYPDGTQKIIFNTTEPHLVDGEMNNLIDWTNRQLNSREFHSLIVVAFFVYEFLSIHPFQDGNGRLSRLLTTLLMLKNEYFFIQYISFENLIEKKKKQYYEALMESQKHRNTNKENIDSWILYFLKSIETLIKMLEEKYDAYKSKGGYMNERQKQLVKIIKRNQPIKVADLTTFLPDISINTIKKDLQYLKSEQIIEALGKNKATCYLVKNKSNKT